MSRGNKNRGRGGYYGDQRGGSPYNRGRGYGRGRRRGGGGGRGRGGSFPVDEFDFPIQQWPDNQPPNSRGTGTPRARGRGGFVQSATHQDFSPRRGTDSPRSRGRGSGSGDPLDAPPYAGGRGRGQRGRNMGSRMRAGVPLSKLLDEDRPYLKPIVFVRSVHTATLFNKEEEILQPLAEPVADDEASHVPTADQVTRVFGGEKEAPGDAVDPSTSSDGEQLEEIDFSEIGQIQAAVDAAAAVRQGAKEEARETVATVEDEFTGFYIDTTPAPIQAHNSVLYDRPEGVLGEDDEVIVYVAPHPRAGPASHTSTIATAVEAVSTNSILTRTTNTEQRREETTIAEPVTMELRVESATMELRAESTTTELPAESSQTLVVNTPAAPSFESISFSFDRTPHKKQIRRIFPVGGPRSLLKRNHKARRRSLGRFGLYGAKLSEAHLQEGRERDPHESEQRRGDSDINWGDSDSDEAIEEVSNGIGGMDLDADVDISLEATKSFVGSMSVEGSRHVTMDDIADIERIRMEDDGEDDTDRADESAEESSEDESESDDEIERVVDAEERLLVGDDEEDLDSDADFSDEEETPRSGFKTKLAKIRAHSSGKDKGKGKAVHIDDSSDEAMSVQTRWEEDDEFFAKIEDILQENAEIFNTQKARNKLFRAITNGDFDADEFDTMLKPATRRRDKNVPLELQDQWEKDRQKKAENKAKRRQAILELAADPLAKHKGGKKGRKTMLAAAKLDDSTDIPNRIIDMVTLEQQIRRFLADLGGKPVMKLPPADKATRKNIHDLANAFNLKSESKGKGDGRFTTLIKTSRSGVRINEKKVKAIMKRSAKNWEGPEKGKGGGGKMSLAKHKEGEEVGKAAPKIGESNIGFKMLAAMGWAEGDRIGLSGGLDAPLTAVMKKTKLGLGATL